MSEINYKVTVDDSEAKKKLNDLWAFLKSGESKTKSIIDFDKTEKGLKRVLDNLEKVKSKTASIGGLNVDGSGDAKRSTGAIRQLSDEQKKLKQAQLDNIESIRRLREERSKEIGELNLLKQIEQEHKATLAEKKAAAQDLTQTEKELNIQYKQGQIEMQEYNRLLKEQAEERRKATAAEREATKAVKEAEKASKDAEREAEKAAKAAEKRRKQLEKESSEYYQLNKALGSVRKEAKDVLAEMFKLERQGLKNSAAYELLENQSKDLVAQTQYLDKGIKKIDASLGLHQRNVGNYAAALDNIIPIVGRVNSQLAMFGTSIDDIAGKPGIFKEIGAGITSAFKNLVAFVSTPIGAAVATIGGLFALFQANKDTVIQFDDGLKSVSKTTGLSGKALQQYSDDIIQLSRALKTVESKQLLEYSQVAGQLGVKGRDNLLAFSDALAKLETASDIRGEEGATKIARLLTLTDGGVQNVKEFGDEIVNLGNNFAATESEILTNAEAIGQNVGLYKIGRKDVLAYATATKAVGLEAEVVGSTFSRTLGQFEKMTRSGKGVNDLLKIIGGTQSDLQKRFKTDASGVFMDYIRGLNKINQAGGSVNEALERTGIIAVRDQRVIASLASTGYDTLTNAMNTAKNASGAMQAEFETGASKLVNQIKRINIAWDNLVLSIENGSGAIGKTSVAIIGYVADMLEAFNKIADSANIFEGVFRYISTGFKMTVPGRAVDWATGGGFDKVSNWIFPNDSKKASEDNSKFFAEFSQKTRAEQLKMIANQEALIKKQNSLNKAFANPVLEENLKKMRSLLKTDVDTSKIDFGVSDKDKRKSERAAEQLRQATERQRSLQLEIDKINETASRNQLSRDESEVASVKDKYAKIREEVDKFYRNPKNKGLKVNTSGLVASENFEVSEAEIRQNTKATETQFDAQKKFLDEYNAYAEQTSKAAADKRYAKELAIFKDYEQNVRATYDSLVTKKKTADLAQYVSTMKFTQAEEEALKKLSIRIAEIDQNKRQRESKGLIEALRAAQTVNDKLVAIEQDYQDKIKSLRDNNELTPDREKLLNKQKGRSTSQVAVEELTGSIEWETLFSGMDEMGVKQIENLISTIETKFDDLKGKFDPIDLQNLKRQLREAQNVLIEKNPFTQLASSIKVIMNNAGNDSAEAAEKTKTAWVNLSKSTKNSFDFISNAVESASVLKDAIGEVGATALSSLTALSVAAVAVTSAIKTAERASVILAVIQAALVVVQSLFSFLSSASKKRNEELKKEQDYYNTLSETFDILIDKQKELFSQKSGKDSMDAYKEAIDLVNSKLIANRKSLEAWFSQGASLFKHSNWYNYDKELGNVLSRQKLLNMTSQEWSDLLLKQPTLWARLPEEVRKYGQSMIDAKGQTKELTDALQEALSGISLDDIRGEFESLFSQADLTFGDISDSFYKHMQKAVMRLVQDGKMTQSIQEWYDKVTDSLSDGTLTESESENLKAQYQAIAEAGNKRYQEIMGLIGYEGDTKSSGLKGSIQKEMTEATASELTGLFRSTFELSKRSLQESQSQTISMGKIVEMTSNGLVVLNNIQNNTAATVVELQNAVSELKNINKNTSPQSMRAYGGG
ncbi:phage tail tape measure protein [Sphingobacterium multivorum]|uniref:phage tail tape measure protein n=1 Tax=Sphingobacterium multivorum TaxID=28454 RepID=UPI0028ACE33D|nr:phage tail tape measure protein [Sphingobacterium multivorum]